MRHIRGEFDHLGGLAGGIENGIVGSLDPHFPSAFADTLEFTRHILAAIQLRPELPVVGTLAVGFFDEHAVVLTLNLIQRVAQRLQEVVVRLGNRAIHLELDDSLRLADGGDLAVQLNLGGFNADRFGDDFPCRHRPAVFLVLVVDRRDQKTQKFRAHFDPRLVGKVFVIGQHAALMRGVLVEGIDGLAHHFGNLDRQKLLQALQSLAGPRVHVLDL